MKDFSNERRINVFPINSLSLSFVLVLQEFIGIAEDFIANGFQLKSCAAAAC